MAGEKEEREEGLNDLKERLSDFPWNPPIGSRPVSFDMLFFFENRCTYY